jgi:membrane associated rhomboid family serine protease
MNEDGSREGRHARQGPEGEEKWHDATERLSDELPAPPVNHETAWNWSLVLQATNVPHRNRRSGFGWRIFVPSSSLEEAVLQIESYERENISPEIPAGPEPSGFETGWTTLLVLAAGALFHAVASGRVISFDLWKIPWRELGMADAGLIRHGEWWRVITALTLHADPAHFFSNAAIGGVFMYILSRELKSGAAWLLFLASGGLGNMVNAWVHGPNHLSLGASTAVFGAVAALTAYRAMENRSLKIKSTLAPAAAGLAILAFMGTGGERTDLLAHLFGFLAGLPMGAFAGLLARTYGPPDEALNRLAGFAALCIPVYAWNKALSGYETVPFSLW